MAELRRCPFCGSEAKLKCYYPPFGKRRKSIVQCTRCRCNSTVYFGGREIHTLKEWRQPFDYFHANYEVIAWMPLPEPYKGDDDK